MSTKNSKLYKGALENAGLGEIAFYLKKAKQNLAYAEYALNNTDFSEVANKSRKINKKIGNLRQTILEIDNEIETVGLELVEALESYEEGE